MVDMCQVIIIIITIIVQKHLQEIIQCQDAVEHWKLEAQNAETTIGKQTQDGDEIAAARARKMWGWS